MALNGGKLYIEVENKLVSVMTSNTVEPRAVRKLSAHTGAIRVRSDSREVVFTSLEMSTLRVPRCFRRLSLSW
jgi:hypothetical protein